MRKTGQTTRLVNHYIQKMIDNPGQSYQIVDHYNDVHNNSILVKRIEHRLQNEYPNNIDITHHMDNYGKISTGINTMSVRYSPDVLNRRDIFIGRLVDKIIEVLFTHRNEQVEVYQYITEVYNANPKLGYPTVNIDFFNKVFEFVKERLRYEHKLDPIKLLSIDYSLEKNNEYIIFTLYTNEYLEDLFSLNNNKTRTRINNMEMFSNVGVYNVDAVKVDNFDKYINGYLDKEISDRITVKVDYSDSMSNIKNGYGELYHRIENIWESEITNKIDQRIINNMNENDNTKNNNHRVSLTNTSNSNSVTNLTDCITTVTGNSNSITNLAGAIKVVTDNINAVSVSTTGCIDVIDELKDEIEKLKNKGKYKMPDNKIQINKMNIFK